MDRAQRRQRRIDQKMWGGGERAGGRQKHQVGNEASICESSGQPGWKCSLCGVSERGTPMIRSGPGGRKAFCKDCALKWEQKGATGGGGSGNVSAEESTDDVTVFEAGFDPTTKDLVAQLHSSDARGLKWKKIAEERAGFKWERIAIEVKEVRNENQCMKLVIEEMRESEAVHVVLESKLKAEIQKLKEKNSELMKFVENVEQAVQHARSSEKNSDHAASKGLGNAGRNAHESIAEANVCNGDQDKGHRQPSKRTGNSERNQFESAADVNVDIEQQATDCHQEQQAQHLGGNGSGIAKVGHTNGNPNECLHNNEKASSLEKNGHDCEGDVRIGGTEGRDDEERNVSARPQPAPSVLDIKSQNEPEVLFTAAQRKAALALVDQEFLNWLKSRTRRPTAKEMSFHKSVVDPCRNWSRSEEAYSWAGISGTLLLNKFHTETDIEKPDCNALTDLLKSVFHIGGARRGNDMLWCLVWADCVKTEQLPGYISLRPRDTRRARVADDECAVRSGKARHQNNERLD